MAMLEDSVEEFKKLPTAGKVGIGAAILLVVGVALYERNKAATASTSSLSGITANGADTTAANASQSPFSMVGNTPLLPPGTNPVYDPSGNLVAFQPVSTVNVPPPTVTPPVSHPTQPPAQPTVNNNPLVPNSLRVWMGKGGILYQGTNGHNQSVVKLPKNSGIRAGSNGRYWVFTPSGQQLITNNFGAKPAG